MSNVMYNIFVG